VRTGWLCGRHPEPWRQFVEALLRPAVREAIKRRDRGEESLADIGRSYNVSGATISRLMPRIRPPGVRRKNAT
jgi:hypothetical protein